MTPHSQSLRVGCTRELYIYIRIFELVSRDLKLSVTVAHCTVYILNIIGRVTPYIYSYKTCVLALFRQTGWTKPSSFDLRMHAGSTGLALDDMSLFEHKKTMMRTKFH